MPKLPGINHKRAGKAFQKAGFWVVREGKHITMTNGERIITLPRADPINAFTILRNRWMSDMLNLAFLSIKLPELKLGFNFANVSFTHILIHASTHSPFYPMWVKITDF